MIRRHVLLLLAASLMSLPHHALAQTPGIPKVGVLISHAAANDPVFESLREGLRELGYEDGRNISLSFVSARGQLDRLPALAKDLVNQGADVIVSTNEVSTRAAQKATAAIPIVMVGFGYDPVSLGLIDDVRRPGGNTTGTFSSTPDLEAKRLEVLKQTIPEVSHVAVLRHAPFGKSAVDDLRRAAQTLEVRLELIELQNADELRLAFLSAKRKKVGAVLLVWSPIFYVARDRLEALALETKLPIIASYAFQNSALISYGIDAGESLRRAAYYVDRLLKGASPRDLPVEQLSKLKLTVNMKMAKALGIKIPSSVLARADEVIR